MITVTFFQAITMLLFILVCIFVTYQNSMKLIAYRKQTDEVGSVFIYLVKVGVLRIAREQLPHEASEIDHQMRKAYRAFNRLSRMNRK